jgi:hypothetical protein
VFCFGVNAAGIVSSAISMVASAVNVASEGDANCLPSFRFLYLPAAAINNDQKIDCGFDIALFGRVEVNLAGAVKA